MKEGIELIEKKISQLDRELNETSKTASGEIESQLTEKVAPLLKQAREIESQIRADVKAKHQFRVNTYLETKKELQSQLNALRIEQAKSIWHPHGTIVELWEKKWSRNKYEKTGQFGTVQIFDGTQDTANNLRSVSIPKWCDIVVFHNKKDGTIGKKFDKIVEYGQIRGYFPMWLAEGETPENNLTKRIEEAKENEVETEYEY